MFLIAISLFPVFVILTYIYFRDKYEKEPPGLLLKAFMGGILSAMVTLLALSPLDGFDIMMESVVLNSIIRAFAWAAIPEEFFKFVFLYLIIWKNRNFNEYYDGIVYSVFVSLGFASLENVLYVTQHGVTVGIMRGVLAVPAHALFGIIMGYFLSLARFSNTKTLINLAKSLLYAIMVHGFYDFLIFWFADSAGENPLLSIFLVITFFIFVIYLWRAGFRKINQHLQSSVFRN